MYELIYHVNNVVPSKKKPIVALKGWSLFSYSLQVSFTLNEELTVIEGLEDKMVSAPREHPFTMQSVGGQTLAVFTESSSGEFLGPARGCRVSALNAFGAT